MKTNIRTVTIRGYDAVDNTELFIFFNLRLMPSVTLDGLTLWIGNQLAERNGPTLDLIPVSIRIEGRETSDIVDGDIIVCYFNHSASGGNSRLANAAIGVGAATAGVGATGAAFINGVSWVGFGAAGVVKGSIAAGIQSGIGSVASGSSFAFFQSLGASTLAGPAAPLVAGGLITTGLLAAGIGIAVKKYGNSQQKKDNI